MVQMTLELPDELARKITPIRSWLPAILEVSFVGFRTVAAETATEVIQFLSAGPSKSEVVEYHASERAQARLRRLLALNQAGLLSEAERLELDELEKLEHIIAMLKARIAHRKP